MKSVEDEFVDSLIKSLKMSENSLVCIEGYYGFSNESDSGKIDTKVLTGLKGIEDVHLVVEIKKDFFGDEVVKKVSYKTDRKFGSEKEIVNGKNVDELKKLVFSLTKRAKSKEVEERAKMDLSVKQEIIERLRNV